MAVERAWWQDYLRAVNRAAVWATRRWKQYHCVQSWRKDVIAILRKAMPSFVAGGSHGRSALEHALYEVMHLFMNGPREVLRQPRGKARPREPTDEEVNVGLKRFLQEGAPREA